MQTQPTISQQPLPHWQVLRKAQVAKMLNLSKATLDRLRADPSSGFPAPMMLSTQAIGWSQSAVIAWLESRPLAHHFVESL